VSKEQCAHGVEKRAEGGHYAVSPRYSSWSAIRIYDTKGGGLARVCCVCGDSERENDAVVLVGIVVQFVDRRVSFVTNVLATPNMSF
jgi:hypothetical protein